MNTVRFLMPGYLDGFNSYWHDLHKDLKVIESIGRGSVMTWAYLDNREKAMVAFVPT